MSTDDDASLPADSLLGHPLTTRLAGIGRRLRQFDTRHRWVLDTAVVAVVFMVFGLADLLHRDGPRDLPVGFRELPAAGTLLLQAGLVLPLWWRRRAPTATFYAVAAVFVVQWLLFVVLRADIALLVATYSLVLHGRPARWLWAGATLAAALTVVALRVSSVVSVWDALFFLFAAATAAAALGIAVRIRRAQLAALRDRALRLEIERDQRSKLASAAERTRVAREMHDIVGHSLSVIITLADGGAYAADTDPDRGKEALHLIGDTGRRALAELRRMLGVLREHSDAPQLSPQPQIADIAALCDRIRTAGPHVTYRSSGDLGALDVGVQLAAYRIAQEALTNALKHAGPHTRITLSLVAEPTRLHLTVADTGPPGGPSGTAPAGEGHGLTGMVERAALYGGTVTAGPGSGNGWTLHADLDLTPAGETQP